MVEAPRINLPRVVNAYLVPSQALWRTVELSCLQTVLASEQPSQPILDVGCGDGAFGRLMFDKIELGIDQNPRAVRRCRQREGYGEVRCVDIADDSLRKDYFSTVLANSTLEHIIDLESALTSINKCLRPGGLLVTAVPLREMNEHFLLKSRTYGRFRQAQLHHEHLLSHQEWRDALERHGFRGIQHRLYLSASTLRHWDRLDSPMYAGFGRYTIGAAISALNRVDYLARPLRRLAYLLLTHLTPASLQDGCCAAVFTARKQ